MPIINQKKKGTGIGNMTRAQLKGFISGSAGAGADGSDGADAFTIFATSGGVIMAAVVNSSGAVTDNASDFVLIKGLRANTTIVNNGNTAGAEGTTNDRFALDVETNDKVTGHSYDTSGNERDVHSTWNSGKIELRDNSVSGAIIAKLTVSDTGNDAKLLLTDFATDQRGASSNTLQKIVVDVPVDVRVNGASVTGYPVTITIVKNIPGANGSNGSNGSDGSDGSDGAAAHRIWLTGGHQITATHVTSAGAVTNSSADYVEVKGLLYPSTSILYNGNTAGAEGGTNNRFALDVETTDKVTGHSYDIDGNERDVHSTWNSSYIELRDNSTGGSIIAKLTPTDTGDNAKLLLTDFATDQRGGSSNTLQQIKVDIPVDVRVNSTSTDETVSLDIIKNIPGASGGTARSYLNLTGSFADASRAISAGTLHAPSGGTQTPFSGINYTNITFHNNSLNYGTSGGEASENLSASWDSGNAYGDEAVFAVVPANETWHIKSLTGTMKFDSDHQGNGSTSLQLYVLLYKTDVALSSGFEGNTMTRLGLDDDVGLTNEDHGTSVVSASCQASVASNRGLVPLIYVRSWTPDNAALTNIGFSLTLEYEIT